MRQSMKNIAVTDTRRNTQTDKQQQQKDAESPVIRKRRLDLANAVKRTNEQKKERMMTPTGLSPARI